MRKIIPCILSLFLLCGCVSAPQKGREDTHLFRVSAVQFAVKETIYAEPNTFSTYIEKLCAEIVREHHPDLIIFPEYTGVFLAVSSYSDVFSVCASLSEALALLREIDPEIQSLFDVFILQAQEVSDYMDRFFSGIAAEYGVYVVGGSYFHAVENSTGEMELRNRLVVYNPEGKRCYEQDKVYLTPFETDLLDLSPGNYPDEPGIIIKGVPVVFTICRDAFFDEWERVNARGYLWIDIKANGDTYDEDARQTFARALPARLRNGTVPYGITVALTGAFLELFWEGISTAYKVTDGKAIPISKTKMWDRQEVLHLTFPYPQEEN